MTRHNHNAAACIGIAALTAALADDNAQLERILDDSDCREVACLLAHWMAESLDVVAKASGGDWSPTQVLRQNGIRFAAGEDSAL